MDKYIYFITGDDIGHSRVRKFLIDGETDTKYISRSKNFMKKREEKSYGQLYDWKIFTTDPNEVVRLRLEELERSIRGHETSVNFLESFIDREYKGFFESGLSNPNVKLYNKIRRRKEKEIKKHKSCIKKIKKSVEAIKANMEEE